MKSALFDKDHKCPVSAPVERPAMSNAGGREEEPDLSDVAGEDAWSVRVGRCLSS